VVGGQLRVRDLDTTNGTIIVHCDDTEERASAITETVIDDGDRLEIGSYAIQVKRRA
jgi:pSer/pThr/pTyr-binding forkhead associated (FHA) protein